jgi:Ca2+-binding RTX toxin-like protein
MIIDTTANDVGPCITDITDDSTNSDYSHVTLHGTGQAGATITLYIISGSTTAGNNTQTGSYISTDLTAVVDENGNWTIDISDVDGVNVNDNEFFKVTQTDEAGNVSDFSNIVHYYHGSWVNSTDEATDDFIFTGSGRDVITVDDNDENDNLVIDAGADVDTVVISSDISQLTVTQDENGYLIINDASTDDRIELRDVEFVSIDGTCYTPEQLLGVIANNDGVLCTKEDCTIKNIDVLANDIDLQGDSITVTSATALYGTVEINSDGTLNYIPNPDVHGSDTVTYTITDSEGNTDSATFTVKVISVNDKPVANDDQVTVTENSSITIDVLANDTDVDGDTLTIVDDSSLGADHGTVSINESGEIVYTPNKDFTGTDTITYKISDGNGGFDKATVDVTVEPVIAGLQGEFYNYDQDTGAYGNLDSIADALGVIANQDPNATFVSTSVNYYRVDGKNTTYSNLGGTKSDGSATHLDKWLGEDADSVTYNNKETSGDAVVRLFGNVTLAAGVYSIQVKADDGYQVKIDGVVVSAVDKNQSPATTTVDFAVDNSGYHSVEIIYWDQGGNYVLDIKLSSNGTDYYQLGSDQYPLSHSFDVATESLSSLALAINEYTDGETVDDDFNGLTQNSTLYVNADNDTLVGIDDDNENLIGDDQNNSLYGDTGNDVLVGADGNDYLLGGEGDDWVLGGDGDDVLLSESYDASGNRYGDASADLLDGGAGNDYIEGLAGDDILIGGSESDTLYGGDGNDIVYGGTYDYSNNELISDSSSDDLYGGAGNDKFILDSSVDTLQDFSNSEDSIDMSELLDMDVSTEYAAIQEYLNSHVSVSTDSDNHSSLQLDGVTVANFGDSVSFGSGAEVSVIINDLEFTIKVD